MTPLEFLQAAILRMQFPVIFIVNPDLILMDGSSIEGAVNIVQGTLLGGIVSTTKELARIVLGYFYSEPEIGSHQPVRIDIDSPAILVGVVRHSKKKKALNVATENPKIETTGQESLVENYEYI